MPRNLALFLLAIVGCGRTPEGARPLEAGGNPFQADVEVSARRVRVTWPADTSLSWGWPASDREFGYSVYQWGISVEGMDGPLSIVARVRRPDSAAHSFRSLSALVATAEAGLCHPGMFIRCDTTPVLARVRNGRVVLTLNDRRTIARLFGTRPARVPVWITRPGTSFRYPDSIPIRYLDPQIPLPDSSTLAEAARGRRAYQASISRITRSIPDGPGTGGSLRLALGDSLRLELQETRCQYDVCSPQHAPQGYSAWSVSDSTVVHLRRGCDYNGLHPAAPCVTIYGMRLGETTIRVEGVYGPSDTMPSRTPPERELERQVMVVERP